LNLISNRNVEQTRKIISEFCQKNRAKILHNRQSLSKEQQRLEDRVLKEANLKKKIADEESGEISSAIETNFEIKEEILSKI
ncbi:MAG: hypothetical protein MHPSP_004770, partial [Paramarteilia canceri]